MKHSQIPILNDTEWKKYPLKELKGIAYDYFRNYLSGLTIYNENKGISIKLVNTGAKHTLNARRGIGYEKLVAIKILPSLLKYAKFSSWENPKPSHGQSAIGIMRFVTYAKINGRKRRYTLDIRIDKQGNFYYDLNVYVKNQG